MHFETASLFLITASAVQGVVFAKDVGDYIWNITQYQAGLSHGNPADPTTSWYRFTVSGSIHGSIGSESYIPAFEALCTGSGAGFPLSSDYSDCAMDSTPDESALSVSARIVPYVDNTQAHIAINYVFSTTDEARNYTATAVTDWARLRAPYNFTLSPNEVP
ncbi:hypothetical protein F5B22DRAFT_598406 [Xylaria bambusicola]|uniref:uncharacterized protein n=1 Tax=Xylaria bambusicola TaxID=326684 RepID=UPI002007F6F5|nr:uncharacterized protein F5B22DRAFT_598406 [Xylaria bambusicola]KAI0520802.1 hypothetical protein F5B22DRAFT_598406 [Xylaria bambusicola]